MPGVGIHLESCICAERSEGDNNKTLLERGIPVRGVALKLSLDSGIAMPWNATSNNTLQEARGGAASQRRSVIGGGVHGRGGTGSGIEVAFRWPHGVIAKR
eukprot:6175159-Pleurochrysis_carterae.AAC.2